MDQLEVMVEVRYPVVEEEEEEEEEEWTTKVLNKYVIIISKSISVSSLLVCQF